MPRRVTDFAFLTFFSVTTSAASAGGKNVAVIDYRDKNPVTVGQYWCNFLVKNGHTCTLFPKEGPTALLDPFDVVIDLSVEWSDSSGSLADYIRTGKTVITVEFAPQALGIETNPTVQAWIGANANSGGSNRLFTIVTDPILGNIPPGTELGDCAASICGAVLDTSGHPNAKVLAAYTDHPDPDPIGIMRNSWEGGVTVYLAGFHEQIVLNAVAIGPPVIPTINASGLLVMAAAMALAGAVVIRRRRSSA